MTFLFSLMIVVSTAGWACPLGYGFQTAQHQLPVYDIVSVKPNRTTNSGTRVSATDDSFSATGISLSNLITNAYNIRAGLLINLPKWDDTMRFDILAKITDPDVKVIRSLTNAQRRTLLQPILTDRFQLKTHLETRLEPAYELVIAKSGPRMEHTEDEVEGAKHGGMTIGNNQMIAKSVPLSALTGELSELLGRSVVDKTGLSGKFNITLNWKDESTLLDPSDDGKAAAPSIFTALQEQLGLRLQPAKLPTEVLVIDHVELPSKN